MASPEVTLRPLAAAEIAQLLRVPWSSGLPAKHRLRLARQEADEALYLIAWRAGAPVGHLYIRWLGPEAEPAASSIAECAEIQDFVVAPELRSRGIGRAMLDEAADRARRRGLRRLGLAVGFDNPRARALYERAGFADAGCGEVIVRWQGPDREGGTRWYEQRCAYLVRAISAG